jgi:hypothetical protein
MPAAIELSMRRTPPGPLRPSMASTTAYDTWPSPAVAAHTPDTPADVTCGTAARAADTHRDRHGTQ